MHPMATVSDVDDLETFQGAVQERACHHFVAADYTPLVKTLDQGPKSTAPVTPVDVLEEGVAVDLRELPTGHHSKNAKSSVLWNGNRWAPSESSIPRCRRNVL